MRTHRKYRAEFKKLNRLIFPLYHWSSIAVPAEEFDNAICNTSSIVLYGTETWTLSQNAINMVCSFERIIETTERLTYCRITWCFQHFCARRDYSGLAM
jgi:hypothetical protein